MHTATSIETNQPRRVKSITRKRKKGEKIYKSCCVIYFRYPLTPSSAVMETFQRANRCWPGKPTGDIILSAALNILQGEIN